MKKGVLFLTAITIFSLVACGKNSENDILRDYQNLEKSQEGSIQQAEEKVSFTIPDHLDYELVSKSGKSKVDVNAEVFSEGFDAAAVFDVEYSKIDDDYMKNLAESLFDNGSYVIKKPYLICTKDELQAEIERIKELSASKGLGEEEIYRESEAFYEIITMLEQDEQAINSRAAELKDGQVIAHVENSNWYYVQDGENSLELQYDTGIIEGSVKGREYQLYYISSDAGTSLKLRLLEPDVSPSMLYDMDSTLYDSLFGENKCNIDTARSIAEEMLSRLGYDYFEEESVAKLTCYNGEDSPYLDGYYFYYAPVINGVASCICDNTNAIPVADRDAKKTNYATKESICIKVSHYGLMGISFGSHYNLGQKLSNQTELLDFEEVNEIAKNRMLDLMNILETQNQYIDPDYLTKSWTAFDNICKVKFDYVPLRYDGKYVFVPAWIYLCDYNNYGDESAFCNLYAVACINAMDGTLIQFDYKDEYSFSPYWFEL